MTLVEVLIALGLFIVGFMGIFALSGQLRRVNMYTASKSEASLLAESRLETMINRPWNTATAGSETHGRYTLSWHTTNAVSSATMVNMSVSWADIDGNVFDVKLTSYLAEL